MLLWVSWRVRWNDFVCLTNIITRHFAFMSAFPLLCDPNNIICFVVHVYIYFIWRKGVPFNFKRSLYLSPQYKTFRLGTTIRFRRVSEAWSMPLMNAGTAWSTAAYEVPRRRGSASGSLSPPINAEVSSFFRRESYYINFEADGKRGQWIGGVSWFSSVVWLRNRRVIGISHT